MRRKILLVFGLILVVQVFFAAAASAEYRPQDDTSININLPFQLPNLNTGQLTFNLQQALHQNVTNVSGASIDYYYIWVNVNGEPVAAVDPAKAMY